jgi:hypothetical protein
MRKTHHLQAPVRRPSRVTCRLVTPRNSREAAKVPTVAPVELDAPSNASAATPGGAACTEWAIKAAARTEADTMTCRTASVKAEVRPQSVFLRQHRRKKWKQNSLAEMKQFVEDSQQSRGRNT